MFEKIAIERTLNRWRSTWARPVLLMVDRTPRGGRERRRRKKRRKSRSPVRPPRRGDVSFRSFLSSVGGAYAASCSDRCPKGWGSLNFQIPFFAISFLRHALPSLSASLFAIRTIFQSPANIFTREIEISRMLPSCQQFEGGRILESFQVSKRGIGLRTWVSYLAH